VLHFTYLGRNPQRTDLHQNFLVVADSGVVKCAKIGAEIFRGYYFTGGGSNFRFSY